MLLTSWLRDFGSRLNGFRRPSLRPRLRHSWRGDFSACFTPVIAACVEVLETRTLLSAVVWTGAGGDLAWNDAANWSTDNVPNVAPPSAGDDVTIGNLGGATITVSGAGVAINSLHTGGTSDVIDVSGTSFSFAGNSDLHSALQADSGGTVNFGGTWSDSGDVLLTGSTLNFGGNGTWAAGTLTTDAASAVNFDGSLTTNGGTLAPTGGGRFGLGGGNLYSSTLTLDAGQTLHVDSPTSLNDLTLNANLDLTEHNGIIVSVGHGLTLNGTAFVGSADGSLWGALNFVGTQTLGGTADIVFGGNGTNDLAITTPATTVTIGPNVTVQGIQGYLDLRYYSDDTFVNQGTIAATGAGTDLESDGPGTLVNQGTLSATAGGLLSLHSNTWSNTGTGMASGGGTLDVFRTGTNSGSLTASGGTVSLFDNWTNNGPITASSGGVVNLANGDNTGSITAAGSTINLGGTWTNSGDVALAGSTLNLTGSGTWTGGALGTDGTSAVNFDGSFTTNGGTLAPTGGGRFGLGGGNLYGSTLTLDAGQTLFVDSPTSLNDLTLNANLDLTRPYSGGIFVDVGNGLTLNGTAYVGAADGSTRGEMDFYSTQTVGGTGDIVFGGNAGNRLQISNWGFSVTLGAGLTVHGMAGYLNPYYSNDTFINQGTIAATGAGVDLESDGAGTVINQGTLSAAAGGLLSLHSNTWSNTGTGTASGGGTLDVFRTGTNSGSLTASGGTISLNGNGGTWTSSGSIAASSGGVVNLANGDNTGSITAAGSTVNFGGTWSNSGSVALTGSTLNLGGSGTWNGGTLSTDAAAAVNFDGSFTTNGGTLAPTGGGRFGLGGGSLYSSTLTLDAGQTLFVDSPTSLNDLTLNANLDLTRPYSGGIFVDVGNGLTLNGTAYVGAADGSTRGEMDFYSTQTVGGTGDIVFGGNAGNRLQISNWGLSVTLGAGLTVHGMAGYLNPYYSNDTFINQGTIAATGAGVDLESDGAGTVINQGTLSATAGGLLSLHSNTWSNTGTGMASGGGTLDVFRTGTNSGSLTASGATISLDGDGGTWTSSGSIAASSGGVVNLANGDNTGSITAAGSTVNFGGTWSNSGSVALTGSTLNLGGSGTWNGGTLSTDAAAAVNFDGSFTTNGGTLAPTGGGRFGLGGGNLYSSTLTLDAGQTLFVDSPTSLNDLTLNANLDLTRPYSGGIFVDVGNGLTLNGTAYVGAADGSTRGEMDFYSTQTVGGTGDIVFGGNAGNRLQISNWGLSVTLGAGLTVHGMAGYLNPYYSNDTFINQGTIAATGAGVDLESDGAGTVINQGTLSATAGGLLSLHSNTWSNTGTGMASGGGTLDVFRTGTNSGSLTASGATISLDGDGGTWTSSGSIAASSGGVVNLANGDNTGSITAAGSTVNFGGTWSNSGSVALTGSTLNLGGSGTWNGGTLSTDAAAAVNFDGSFTTNGGTLAPTGGGRFGLGGGSLYSSTLTLDAGQTLFVDSPTSLNDLTLNANLDLTRPYSGGIFVDVGNGLTLNGTAYVGAADGSTRGEMDFYSTQTVGGTGDIVFGGNAGNRLQISNWGLSVTLGAGLTVHGMAGYLNPYYSNDTFINQGTIAATGAGVDLESDGAGTVINQGTLSATAGGLLSLHSNTWSNTGTGMASGGGTLDVFRTGTNSGSLTASGATISLDGDGGTWTSSGSIAASSGGVVNLANGDNTGSITAAGSTVNFGGTWSNSGSVALTGSTLNLGGSGTWNGGTLSTDAAAAVNFDGSFTTNGGTLAPTGGGRFGLGGGNLYSSTLTLDAGQTLFVDSPTSLNDLTLNANLDLTRPYSGGIFVDVGNGLTLNGTAYVGAADGSTRGEMDFYSTQTVGGTGDIVFGGNAGNRLQISNWGLSVTLGAGLTVHGMAGYLNPYYSNDTFINQGTIAATGAGVDLESDGAGTVINQGTLSATAGGLLSLHSNTWSNTGTGMASGGGTLDVFRTGTNSGSLTASGATISLDGDGGTWTSSGSIAASSGGVVNLANGDNTGSITAAGSTVNFGGTWSNSGSVALTGSTLNLGGSGTWNGGTLSTDAAAAVNFDGSFTTDGGTLAPTGGGLLHLSGGSLVNGALTIGAGSRLQFDGGTLDNVSVTNNGNGTWTSGTVTFTNGAAFTNNGTFDDQTDGTFGSNDVTCPVFTNTGTFIKSGGNGTANLEMDFFNSGMVDVQQGILNVTCGYVQTGGSTVATGGSVVGTVQVQGGAVQGNVSTDYTVSGQVDVAPSPAPVVPANSYTQTSTGILNEQIGGLVAGSQYGQIAVTGDVNLDGTLKVTLIDGFTPQLGDPFTIINNEGSNPVSGTFANLPEGDTVWAGPFGFTISYKGGDGNDVVLTTSVIVQSTTTALVESLATATYGDTVMFTATVSPQFNGVPSGTATFYEVDGTGAVISQLGTSALSNGAATFQDSALSAGTHYIAAKFTSSDAGFTDSGLSSPVQLIVNRKSITGVITAISKVYDGTTTAILLSQTLTGVLAADVGSVTLSVGAANFSDANAGTNKLVTATGVALGGSAAGNYVLSSTTATTTANITAKDLIVSGSTQNSINISKAGTLTFAITNVTGEVNGDTRTTYQLFNGAKFTLQIGSNTYSVESTASVDASTGTIYVSWRLTDALYNDLLAVLGTGTPSAKQLTDLIVVGYSKDGNYEITANCMANIFSSGKVIWS